MTNDELHVMKSNIIFLQEGSPASTSLVVQTMTLKQKEKIPGHVLYMGLIYVSLATCNTWDGFKSNENDP